MRVLNSLSDLNIMRILRLVWQTKKVSRVEIASMLKMDKSTVTKIIAELTQNDLAREAESGASGPQGGRKPVFLQINASYACSGGIEINPERMYVCLEDFCGTILYEHMQEITPDAYAQKGFLGFVQEGVDLLKAASQRLRIKLAGIGLGIPGMVESDGSRIIQSIPLLIEDGLDVAADIQPMSDIPIFVENDARCCCYTEQMLSRGPKTQNMMYVLAEHRPLQPVKDSPKNLSVGLGLILNGKIYHGANSTAGEFRSVYWQSPSKTQFSPESSSVQALDDANAQKTFRELAKNIAFLVNTLSLDVVYVGGLEKKFAEEIVKYIRQEIVYLWPYGWNKTTVVSTALVSQRSVSYGAGAKVLDKLFSVPELDEGGRKRKTPAASPYKYLLSLQ
ncbi:MAG: ROK family transcriptional regulator [Treponema sp.]|nr:ROK family transcriptional regulator [Treponema sp.]